MRSNEQLVYLFLEELQTGKPDLIANKLSPEAEIHICLGNQFYMDSYSATFVGKRGINNLFNLCQQFFEIKNITPTEFHHDRQKMIVRGDLKCNLLSTQETWNSSWMQIWTLEKGDISKLRIFADYTVIPRAELADLRRGVSTIDTLRH